MCFCLEMPGSLFFCHRIAVVPGVWAGTVAAVGMPVADDAYLFSAAKESKCLCVVQSLKRYSQGSFSAW